MSSNDPILMTCGIDVGTSAVKVAIMRGAGGQAFVSGADISEFDQVRATAAQEEAYGKVAGRANRWLAGFDKPFIALIEGYCIGGGLATALSADIRIATPDSRFGIPAARLGLGYGYQGLAKLARVVGPARARDIMFSARYMEAEEAQRMGLVNFVYSRTEIEAETVIYAERIAANAPLTVKAAKAALREDAENDVGLGDLSIGIGLDALAPGEVGLDSEPRVLVKQRHYAGRRRAGGARNGGGALREPLGLSSARAGALSTTPGRRRPETDDPRGAGNRSRCRECRSRSRVRPSSRCGRRRAAGRRDRRTRHGSI